MRERHRERERKTERERESERKTERERESLYCRYHLLFACLSVCVYVYSRVLSGRRASFGGDLTSGSSLNTVTASRYVCNVLHTVTAGRYVCTAEISPS